MGFGYKQARAAGLRGIRADRSPGQVNRTVAKSKEERECVYYLRAAVEADPEWGPFIAHWVNEGLSAEATYQSLICARHYAKWMHYPRLRNKKLPPF